ncbi:ROK family protein [Mycolicibacterium gilvum]|uniref:Glucokinase n=1 Tax=Mycolicibacterium gilvum TaxID=1804 RepID=A0A378SGN7_9MYCO|nr:ROK family protein [Mycolicibacterium gilvum]MCV7056062.1 ROK family protein [Mycolicibacterium gilvum]STZ41903.1 glucokinase [Mycolicibacterium gilvum]
MSALTLALDIGGTKLAAGLVDADGNLVHRAQTPTPDGDPEILWAAVASLLTDVRSAAEATIGAVGIASAGPVDVPAGTVSPINITEWHRFPIVERVETATGLPAYLGGDGLCMAMGEWWRGAGRGRRSLLRMVVSTGIGGGLVLDGAPFHGRTGNAGHVGHVVVEPDGDACTCGGRGCVETVASGPHLARWARTHGWAGADARQLAEDAAGGDEVALRAFARGADAVARTIASVAAVCDLDLVVVGGGVAKSGALLFDPLRASLQTYAGLDFLRGLQVVAAELGGDAGLVGAAALAAHHGRFG